MPLNQTITTTITPSSICDYIHCVRKPQTHNIKQPQPQSHRKVYIKKINQLHWITSPLRLYQLTQPHWLVSDKDNTKLTALGTHNHIHSFIFAFRAFLAVKIERFLQAALRIRAPLLWSAVLPQAEARAEGERAGLPEVQAVPGPALFLLPPPFRQMGLKLFYMPLFRMKTQSNFSLELRKQRIY